MEYNKIYHEEDFVIHCLERETQAAVYVNPLTTLANYIINHGEVTDLTVKNMFDVRYRHKTWYQIISLHEKGIYSQAENRFLVHYTCDITSIALAQSEYITELRTSMNTLKRIIAFLVFIIVILVIYHG